MKKLTVNFTGEFQYIDKSIRLWKVELVDDGSPFSKLFAVTNRVGKLDMETFLQPVDDRLVIVGEDPLRGVSITRAMRDKVTFDPVNDAATFVVKFNIQPNGDHVRRTLSRKTHIHFVMTGYLDNPSYLEAVKTLNFYRDRVAEQTERRQTAYDELFDIGDK